MSGGAYALVAVKVVVAEHPEARKDQPHLECRRSQIIAL
jgi:hypothetical protein